MDGETQHMKKDDILGSWQSKAVATAAGYQEYDRQKLTFYSDGTGRMDSRTLFGRHRSFTWSFTGDSFLIYNMAGNGSVAQALLETDGSMGVMESGMLILYWKC